MALIEGEVWVKITDYDYEVSNMGRVRSMDRYVQRFPDKPDEFALRKSRSISMVKDKNGYLRFALSKNGKQKHVRLHRIVAEHFIDNPDNLPEVNHIIPDKENNKASNLEWTTPEANKKHAKENGLLPFKDSMKKFEDDQVVIIREEYATGNFSIAELARKYKVDRRTIYYMTQRRTYAWVL